ncbi:DHA2 family multidrug resistance protein-like MFS transporter [Crossiella equi]|uniref:DHA2 family multidrug resistance protein-like MFS transporter n=1 Tax=Crossiella equi TaxID=130796 RepID=A0ABS5AFP6_9PSEU|nr:MFS transporter [Crossiella equi]MBP2475409.1 DHA2 family multidrug resistance protein-like MFS transporter [Crossiella equi]
MTEVSQTGLPPRSRWVALSALVLAVLLIAVDGTVLHLALPMITEELKPSSQELLWIGDIYSFVLAGLLVTMGTLGDRIGRKKLLLVGAVAFGLISVLAAFATSSAMLIAARALLGLAGATIMPSTLSIIRNLFTDDRERVLAIGIWGAMTSAGAAVGPVVGGLLLQHFHWGAVFLINVPVMLVLLVVGWRVLPESRDPRPGPWDLPSALASLVGMVALVYGIKEIAAVGFGLEAVLGLAVGVLALAWFARRQLTLPVPLVDVRLFRTGKFSGAVFADLLAVLALSGVVFFGAQFLQLVQGYEPFAAGIRELPVTVGSVISGLLAGAFAARYSPRAVCGIGLGVTALALGAMVFINADTPYLYFGLILLVVGFGCGASFTISASVVLSAVPKEKAGSASAVAETAYELGTALGIALIGSIMTSVYRANVIPPLGISPGDAATAKDSLGGATEVAKPLGELGQQLVDVAKAAFVDGMHAASVASALVLGVAAVSAWFMLRGVELKENVEH